eukprot:CAMPEP_0198238116 /NCGR_PEP_ID=MMETSP1446-20131203/3843_1 /TAXON_ID=1461542 ORGANISM="Unidentified sp, Strain CCMP2111" /NCGR_SAMPLE_ID=MMETSP1446 /ASSEMBLY_ACC=CAM_ASM_001112 /LENGTH=64 /DNA_ID=CAMNT_0043920457 /DNA_START=272 /DNA_END=466 /DNA_ORIENTATION=+
MTFHWEAMPSGKVSKTNGIEDESKKVRKRAIPKLPEKQSNADEPPRPRGKQHHRQRQLQFAMGS